MRVLITGSGGFVGKHLIANLQEKGHNVFASVLNRNYHQNNNKNLTLDVTKLEDVKRILNEINPEIVIHLAAQSNVGKAWGNPSLTYNINTIGTINLVESIGKYSPETKIISIGSS